MHRFSLKPLVVASACLVCVSLTGCSSSWTLDLSNANQRSAPTITPAQLYEDWVVVKPGVDFKQVLVEQGSSEELLDIVRIDPEQVDISFHVNEAEPLTVSAWQEKLGATVVINASYFDEDYQLVTRTRTSQGNTGPLLSGQTGFFYQLTDAWRLSDVAPDTQATQLLQSYPVLVDKGQAQVETSIDDQAQRTVVAMNAAGTIYFIVAEYGVLTLTQLSEVLADLDQPNIETALNLDGGSSTGLIVMSGQLEYSDDSFVVPSVVAIQ